MQAEKFTPEIAMALSAAQNTRVREIARELSKYNLGVSVPHIHRDQVADVLPEDTIQYENDLRVSFPDKDKFFAKRHNAFPVAWRWNDAEGRLEACAWCHDD